MSRPRSDGPRYPCGRLRPAKPPASVVEAEQRTAYRQLDDELAADMLAIRTIATPNEYGRWIDSEYDMDVLSERARAYLKRDRQFREYLRKCKQLQLSLLEMRRWPTNGEHAAA